jgi:hypothetical protein
MENNFAAGHVIVRFKDGVSEPKWAEVVRSEDCYVLDNIGQSVLVLTPLGKESEYITKFQNKQEVKFAELDYLATTCKT